LSENQEPSYYEIALTNRQVLAAFVVLLACVLLSFFAGVWVGKGSPAAAVAETPGPLVEPTPGTGEPEELSFFNDGQRPNLPELAENPRPDSTLAEDLGLEERPRPTAPPAATTPPAPPQAAATAPVAPPPARDDEGNTIPVLRPGEVIIQVFSSRDEIQARRLTTQLKAAGFKAFLSPSGEMYRVRIGPFSDRQQAQAVAQRAKRDFRVDTWITASP
jgi:cell division septation protein DedD